MQFDLNSALSWTRRWSNDEIRRYRQKTTSDGGGEITLRVGADALINILNITSDNEVIDPVADVTMSGNVVIFDPSDVLDGATVIISYESAVYSSIRILGFLCDAARDVGAELGIAWLVDEDNHLIDQIPDNAQETIGNLSQLHSLCQKLITLKASLDIVNDQAKQAAGQSIMVKDGDTTIDTSKAANARDRSVRMVSLEYERALERAKIRRFSGTSSTL